MIHLTDAVGQRVKTMFGEGQILSVIEPNQQGGFRYRIKLPYGIGYIRPESVVHVMRGGKEHHVRNGNRMERHHDNLEGSCERLHSKFTLLFGSQPIYVFLRLYLGLIKLMEIVEDYLRQRQQEMPTSTSRKNDNPRGDVRVGKKHDFRAYMKVLKKFLSSSDPKPLEFERYCRKGDALRREAQLSWLPRLVEKCADALVRVAREDILLTIFDFSMMYNKTDPVRLRSQCMTIIDNACFRVQCSKSRRGIHKCYFAYLEPDQDLLATPRDEDEEVGGQAMEEYVDEHMDDHDEGEAYEEEEEPGTVSMEGPQPKRAKLK